MILVVLHSSRTRVAVQSFVTELPSAPKLDTLNGCGGGTAAITARLGPAKIRTTFLPVSNRNSKFPIWHGLTEMVNLTVSKNDHWRERIPATQAPDPTLAFLTFQGIDPCRSLEKQAS